MASAAPPGGDGSPPNQPPYRRDGVDQSPTSKSAAARGKGRKRKQPEGAGEESAGNDPDGVQLQPLPLLEQVAQAMQEQLQPAAADAAPAPPAPPEVEAKRNFPCTVSRCPMAFNNGQQLGGHMRWCLFKGTNPVPPPPPPPGCFGSGTAPAGFSTGTSSSNYSASSSSNQLLPPGYPSSSMYRPQDWRAMGFIPGTSHQPPPPRNPLGPQSQNCGWFPFAGGPGPSGMMRPSQQHPQSRLLPHPNYRPPPPRLLHFRHLPLGLNLPSSSSASASGSNQERELDLTLRLAPPSPPPEHEQQHQPPPPREEDDDDDDRQGGVDLELRLSL